jgi:hypothetical protein
MVNPVPQPQNVPAPAVVVPVQQGSVCYSFRIFLKIFRHLLLRSFSRTGELTKPDLSNVLKKYRSTFFKNSQNTNLIESGFERILCDTPSRTTQDRQSNPIGCYGKRHLLRFLFWFYGWERTVNSWLNISVMAQFLECGQTKKLYYRRRFCEDC